MRVCVVGGGVSGLAAADALSETVPGARVQVLEAADRVGGKLDTLDLDGVGLDAGAESVLARRPEALELIARLGLAGRQVHPTQARPALLVNGGLCDLPPSVLGVPADPAALSAILSPAAAARARSEVPLPVLERDLPIGTAVDLAFGTEVTDRLLEPMLGGVYAGRARELSFAAVAPGLFAAVRSGGLLSAAAASLDRGRIDAPVFAGLTGGIATLATALADRLASRGVAVRPRASVRALTREGNGWRLTVGSAAAPEHARADAVVLAVPAVPAARLLADLSPPRWADLRYASVALVTMAVAGLRPEHSGVLVPLGGLPTVKALTYSSTKWSWVARAAAERWGEGVAVVRASVGRVGEEAVLQVGDADLVRRSFAEAATVPGWANARLLHGRVRRWGGALPQYGVGHLDLVAALRSAVAGQPGLAVCGAALDGVGIAACLASAQAAAAKLGADLDLKG